MSIQLPRIFATNQISFNDTDLLRLALTHASKSREANNQRLEFLGDRVLGLVLADTLYALYPDENEGALALRHAALVKAGTIAEIARHYELGKDLLAASAERSGSAGSVDNVLADTLEALIGALYLDQGYEVCRKFVDVLWHDAVHALTAPPQDPKNTLQEWAQGRGLPLPTYQLLGREGPDHAPQFTVEVLIKPDHRAKGSGNTRRLAEKQAASSLLALLNQAKS